MIQNNIVVTCYYFVRIVFECLSSRPRLLMLCCRGSCCRLIFIHQHAVGLPSALFKCFFRQKRN